MTLTPAHPEPDFLRRLRTQPPKLRMTPLLIAACVLIYALMLVSGVNPISPTVGELAAWGGNARPLTLEAGQYWRLFTAVFLHAGLVHLGMNMYVLWYIGRFVEPLCGNLRFLVFYLLCGLCGSLATLVAHAHVLSVGASGAIFGLYGVVLGVVLRHHAALPRQTSRALVRSGGYFIALNLIVGLSLPGIDLSAHIGGLIGGFLLGLLFMN